MRQNHRPVFRHRNAVFKMRAEAAVCGHRRPLISQDARLRLAVIHHRLNCENHSLAQPGAVAAIPEVRHLRFFMQPSTNAVPYKLADDAETRRLDVLLDGGSNISNRVAVPASNRCPQAP